MAKKYVPKREGFQSKFVSALLDVELPTVTVATLMAATWSWLYWNPWLLLFAFPWTVPASSGNGGWF